MICLGSCAFHATLRRPAQALDEIPMVLGNLVFVFCLVHPEGKWITRLAACLSASGALLVLVYAVFEFFAVFFIMYGGVVVYLVVHSGMQSFSDSRGANSQVIKQLWKIGIATYGSGFVLWVTDNAVCSQLGVGHLHIAWHALACTGYMLLTLLLIALTADKEGIQVALKLRGGAMPYLVSACTGSDPVEAKKVD
eukprot:UN0037